MRLCHTPIILPATRRAFRVMLYDATPVIIVASCRCVDAAVIFRAVDYIAPADTPPRHTLCRAMLFMPPCRRHYYADYFSLFVYFATL